MSIATLQADQDEDLWRKILQYLTGIPWDSFVLDLFQDSSVLTFTYLWEDPLRLELRSDQALSLLEDVLSCSHIGSSEFYWRGFHLRQDAFNTDMGSRHSFRRLDVIDAEVTDVFFCDMSSQQFDSQLKFPIPKL